VRFNWHTLSHRYKETQSLWDGPPPYGLDESGAS
jgi:hypothetical protein